jgi:hypothetical protein
MGRENTNENHIEVSVIGRPSRELADKIGVLMPILKRRDMFSKLFEAPNQAVAVAMDDNGDLVAAGTVSMTFSSKGEVCRLDNLVYGNDNYRLIAGEALRGPVMQWGEEHGADFFEEPSNPRRLDHELHVFPRMGIPASEVLMLIPARSASF